MCSVTSLTVWAKGHHTIHTYYYRPQRSCGQGYVFTRVCDSVHRGGLQAGRNPPWQEGEPPQQEGEPPRQEGEPPPQTRQTTPPAGGRTPPAPAGRTPPGKQTPEYGLRAAGTHPTGMHSCIAKETTQV